MDAIQAAKKKEKDRKRKQKTPIVGDIGALADTLPTIDLLMKGDTGPKVNRYAGSGPLSHDFKIWPITFQGSGTSGPILFSCKNISL